LKSASAFAIASVGDAVGFFPAGSVSTFEAHEISQNAQLAIVIKR